MQIRSVAILPLAKFGESSHITRTDFTCNGVGSVLVKWQFKGPVFRLWGKPLPGALESICQSKLTIPPRWACGSNQQVAPSHLLQKVQHRMYVVLRTIVKNTNNKSCFFMYTESRAATRNLVQGTCYGGRGYCFLRHYVCRSGYVFKEHLNNCFNKNSYKCCVP